jgi:hypothetical protein
VKHLKKVSTCDIEVDIFATSIVNAKSNFDASEQYSNPGIRSLWIDERLRRANSPFGSNDKVGFKNRQYIKNYENFNCYCFQPVPLEPLLHSSNRENKPTVSDLFYQQGLAVKLDQSKPENKKNHLVVRNVTVFDVENLSFFLNIALKI